MVVEAVYDNGKTIDIENYELVDEEELYFGQTEVTVEFEGFEASQEITVLKSYVDSIIIDEQPNKTEYEEDEYFDPAGMVVKVIYSDGSEEVTEDYDIIDGEALSLGQDTVTIRYEGKTATVEITVVEKPTVIDAKPEPSDFSNIDEKTKMVRGFYYVNKNKEEYVSIDVEITNIGQFAENDGYEYYYFVSDNKSERNIDSWVRIPNGAVVDGKLAFTIDTRDMTNFQEVANADNLYIYVKEVAKLGDEEVETITTPVEIKTENVPAEIYVDDAKQNSYSNISTGEVEIEKNTNDKTLVDRVLPNTGSKIIFVIIVGMISFTAFRYVKYKKLKEIK